jgi:hypothetical protein
MEGPERLDYETPLWLLIAWGRVWFTTGHSSVFSKCSTGRAGSHEVGLVFITWQCLLTSHATWLKLASADVLDAQAQTTSIFTHSRRVPMEPGERCTMQGPTITVWWAISKLLPYVTTKCRRIKGLMAQTDTPRGDSRSFSLWEYYAFQYEIGLFSDCVSCKKVRS